MDNIRESFLRHKWSIIRIYTYVLIAQIILLVEPWLLGKAIDGLLVGEYTFIALLLSAFLLESTFIYKRMVLDTKVYLQIYNEIILNYLKRNKDAPTSTRVARTDMAYSLVSFVENDLHYFIVSAITIIGTLFFIYAGSVQAGIVVTLSAIPTLLVTKTFYRKIAQANRVGNNHYEGKVDVIQSCEESRIIRFYTRRKKIITAASTLQGKNWAGLSASRSTFIILAIIVFTHDRIGITQGEAVTMYSYVSQFLGSLLSIPVAVDVITRMKDVIRRIKETQ
jgi:ABC-type multidrug transport system fused ATPase/permease subunit